MPSRPQARDPQGLMNMKTVKNDAQHVGRSPQDVNLFCGTPPRRTSEKSEGFTSGSLSPYTQRLTAPFGAESSVGLECPLGFRMGPAFAATLFEVASEPLKLLGAIGLVDPFLSSLGPANVRPF
jgi:hypothetical protein